MTYGVLFVCTGNICRSPTAEGVFRHALREAGLHERVTVDSAGTHGYHVGDAPDPRTIAAARQRGVELADLRARLLRNDDFDNFDLILAMDSGHLAYLARMARPGARGRHALFLDYAPEGGFRDVPDPYYGGTDDFELVLDLVQAGVDGLIKHIRQNNI